MTEEVVMRVTPTYMPLETDENMLQAAQALIEDEHIVSDDSGLNNKQKWARVVHVFKAHHATLYSKIDFHDIYASDEARTAEAASFVADLRVQYLGAMLAEKHDEKVHEMWVENRQWQVRLRERARLQAWQAAAKHATKAN